MSNLFLPITHPLMVQDLNDEHLAVYLKNEHALQDDRAGQAQLLCYPLTGRDEGGGRQRWLFCDSVDDWRQTDLNSGWMCNLFVHGLVGMESWEGDKWKRRELSSVLETHGVNSGILTVPDFIQRSILWYHEFSWRTKQSFICLIFKALKIRKLDSLSWFWKV